MKRPPEPGPEPGGEVLAITLPGQARGQRLDRAIIAALPDSAVLSRSRLQALSAAGRVRDADTGATLDELSAKVKEVARIIIDIPPPEPAEPAPEPIPLTIAYEDAHLVVVDKPAGMTVHPARGAPDGTLVNALLAHCGDSLSGIGGTARPGIVHRIDKDTSGLIVVAKTDAAHRGLSAQFAAHDLERVYRAIVWGVPTRAGRLPGHAAVTLERQDFRIEAALGRHASDRKKMAPRADGKRAVTRFRVVEDHGIAAEIECRLETGRTHQIRVHLSHIGHPLIGDPVYGGGRRAPRGHGGRAVIDGFARQALHAAVLGFVHPVTGARVRCESPLPADMERLSAALMGRS